MALDAAKQLPDSENKSKLIKTNRKHCFILPKDSNPRNRRADVIFILTNK